MRSNIFDFEKNSPIFKPPKYTGVTLSLLSIFVLVCMLAVWEKITPKENSIKLYGHAWADCREPLELCKVAFEKETGIPVEIGYLEDFSAKYELNSLDKSVDFHILPSEFAKNKIFHEETWTEKLDLAHHPAEITEDSIYKKAIVGLVSKRTAQSPSTLLFLRYLSAPSRGQFEFASCGWTGVRGDKWRILPTLKILIPLKLKQAFMPILNQFKEREGILWDPQFMAPSSILKVANITSKGDDKQFMPDLIWLPLELDTRHLDSLAFKAIEKSSAGKQLPRAYLSQWSDFQQTALRFNRFATKYLDN